MDRLKEELDLLDRNGAYAQSVRDRGAHGDRTKPYGGRLENWYIQHVARPDGAAYFAGELSDDPNARWRNGQHITTSGVIGYKDGDTKIETRNTLYDLGKPYEKEN